MKKAQHQRQVGRIYDHLMKLASTQELTVEERTDDAERIFRVVSRVTHFQVLGNQRMTAKARREIDTQVVLNVGAILEVL